VARLTGPKSKHARRLSSPIFPKDEKILTKRNYPAGMHGQKRQRLSQYGIQLLEKQKAKWTYGILEKQFRNYYEEAARKKGQTGLMLLQLLERRLDNVVFRLGLATTRPQARQLVSHGFIEVNGKKVNIPSYQVKAGDSVKVRENKQKSKYMIVRKTEMGKHQTPEWLSFDKNDFSAKVLSLPIIEEADRTVNTQLIVEHYSR